MLSPAQFSLPAPQKKKKKVGLFGRRDVELSPSPATCSLWLAATLRWAGSARRTCMSLGAAVGNLKGAGIDMVPLTTRVCLRQSWSELRSGVDPQWD